MICTWCKKEFEDQPLIFADMTFCSDECITSYQDWYSLFDASPHMNTPIGIYKDEDSSVIIFEIKDSIKIATEKGDLIDVTNLAKEQGFTIPVYISKTVWETYVIPPETLSDCQDETGRAWDILTMLSYTIKTSNPKKSKLTFDVLFAMKRNRKPFLYKLKSVCGLGDFGEPIIRILTLDED